MKQPQSIPSPDWYADVRAAMDAIGRKVCGIYRFTCRRTGGVYVGQAKNIAIRIQQHARDAHRLGPKATAWHKALAAAGGINGFLIEVLEVLPADRFLLCERETAWLRAHGAGTAINCFNTRPDGYPSPLGTSLSPVTAERMRAKLSGRPRPQHVKVQISATKLTPEGRARNSAANKGRKHTEEAKRNMSAAQSRPEMKAKTVARLKGKPLSPANYAKLLITARSPEVRAKISAANKGKTVSLEMRQRISATMTGRTYGEERRRRMSESKRRFLASNPSPWKGRTHSEESKARMRVSRLKYFERLNATKAA